MKDYSATRSAGGAGSRAGLKISQVANNSRKFYKIKGFKVPARKYLPEVFNSQRGMGSPGRAMRIQ
jgi:hypothetical protein